MPKRMKYCNNAGCSKCSEGIYVGESFFGNKLYACSKYKHKHKEINALECDKFRCKNPNRGRVCKECKKR